MSKNTDYGFKKIDLIVISEYDLNKIYKLVINNNSEDTKRALKLFESLIK